jgi:predicted DNA-binding transcriptional regulator AlpA
MTQTATASTDRLVFSERDLDAHGVLSRKTRWRLRREGRFPEPRDIGGRKLYIGAEIRAWLEDPERWTSDNRRIGDTE